MAFAAHRKLSHHGRRHLRYLSGGTDLTRFSGNLRAPHAHGNRAISHKADATLHLSSVGHFLVSFHTTIESVTSELMSVLTTRGRSLFRRFTRHKLSSDLVTTVSIHSRTRALVCGGCCIYDERVLPARNMAGLTIVLSLHFQSYRDREDARTTMVFHVERCYRSCGISGYI